MKILGINNAINYNYQYRNINNPIQFEFCEKKLINYQALPLNISFGLANSSKLKTLFSYGLPCIYTDIEEMIDPKRIQKMLKNKQFDGKAIDVLEKIKHFEKSLFPIELKVYKSLLKEARKNPDLTVSGVMQNLVVEHKRKLRRRQLPILQHLTFISKRLPEDYQYQFKQFMTQSLDKLNDKPIKVDFSATEFIYNLEKIQRDIEKRGGQKASRVVKKLLDVSQYLKNGSEISTEEKLNTIDFMGIILRSSVLKTEPQLKKLLSDAKKNLNGEAYIVQFSRKVFIYDLSKLLEGLSNEKLKNKMIAIAMKLPTSRDTASAFIMKHKNNTSEKITYRLLWPSLASVEHIHARALGGPNKMSNYAGACALANSDKSNIDFTEQMKRVPNLKKYCQRYANRLIELAEQGVFDKHKIDKKCIEDFKNTIFIESKGKIDLDISRYYKLL